MPDFYISSAVELWSAPGAMLLKDWGQITFNKQEKGKRDV